MGKFNYAWLVGKRQFRSLTGVEPKIFHAMVARLRPCWQRRIVDSRDRAERPWGVGGLEDHLLALLILYRRAVTQDFLGCLYRVDKAVICRALQRLEPLAAQVLGVKKSIRVGREEAQSLLLDTTEQPIQRPSRKQRCWYSGNKKRHTIKTEIIVTEKGRIVSVSKPVPGSVHDLALRQRGSPLPKDYAKLVLEQSALPKSHRPTKALFRRDLTPVVGAGDLGELYIQVTPSSINRTLCKIAQAKETTTRKEVKSTGKIVITPSRAKSEVGAIKEIKPYTTADKRKFSVTEGLQWLSDSRTGGAYIVELFETPPPRQEWDLLPPEKVRLFQSFVDGLQEMGQGLIASRLSDNFKGYLCEHRQNSFRLPRLRPKVRSFPVCWRSSGATVGKRSSPSSLARLPAERRRERSCPRQNAPAASAVSEPSAGSCVDTSLTKLAPVRLA